MRSLVNSALTDVSPAIDALYLPFGWESIPPERLIRALLLLAFYAIRSERQLVARSELDLLFRWFVGLGVDDPIWDATTVTKNRDRLLEGDVAPAFINALLAQPKVKLLLASEHCAVDGTLPEAWAGSKSFRPLAVHPCHGRFESGAPVEVTDGGSMTPGDCPDTGKNHWAWTCTGASRKAPAPGLSSHPQRDITPPQYSPAAAPPKAHQANAQHDPAFPSPHPW